LGVAFTGPSIQRGKKAMGMGKTCKLFEALPCLVNVLLVLAVEAP
jgi:hypothetical protein